MFLNFKINIQLLCFAICWFINWPHTKKASNKDKPYLLQVTFTRPFTADRDSLFVFSTFLSVLNLSYILCPFQGFISFFQSTGDCPHDWGRHVYQSPISSAGVRLKCPEFILTVNMAQSEPSKTGIEGLSHSQFSNFAIEFQGSICSGRSHSLD